MDNETEVIKQQMEETRGALTDKLEALEHHVMSTVEDTTQSVAETVHSVTDAVHHTVDSVKEGVEQTMESVKEAFDVRQQVERHPWAMLAGAAVIGFIGGRLLTPPRRPFIPEGWGHGNSRPEPVRAPSALAPAAKTEPGWLDEVGHRFQPVIDKVKEMAIGAGAQFAGEMVMSAFGPAMKSEVAAVIDEVATALGGKPMHLENMPERTPPSTPTYTPPESTSAPHNRLRTVKGNGRHG